MDPNLDGVDIATAYVPKLPALASMMCSYAIIREVIRSSTSLGQLWTNTDKMTDRFLLAMSVGDIFMSFPYVLTTWAIPAGIPGYFHNVGTTGTCTMQGVFSRKQASSCV